MSPKKQVVDVKDYASRRAIIGGFSPVVLVLLVAFAAAPVVLFWGASIFPALIGTVLAELLFIAVLVLFCFPSGERKKALAWNKPGLKPVGLAAFSGILLFAGLQLVAFLLTQAGFPLESSETSKQLLNGEGALSYVLMFFMVPFLVPFIEELTFRGAVMGTLLYSNLPRAFAVFYSSAFFAFMHLQSFTFSGLSVVAWILVVALASAWLRLRYDSIFVCTALHVSYNLSTVVASLLFAAN